MNKFRLHIENLTAQASAFHITPERYEKVAQQHPEEAATLDVSFGWDGQGIEAHAQTMDALIGWRFPRETVRRSPTLRWIHATGAGIEHLLPLDWLPEGAVLTNNSGVHADKAGEFAMAAVLALNNRFPYFATMKVERCWSKRFSRVITGKTVLVIGTGHMGQAAALRCRDLRMKVVGVNSAGRPVEGFDATWPVARLDALLPEADFVIVALPLTDQTRGLLSRERLALLKPEAGLVNIGRAGSVDYEALAERLDAGQLAGAILDVFPQEPMPADAPWWNVRNLIITPHVSSDDEEEYAPSTVDLFFRNYRRLRGGEPLMNVVDPARQY